MGAIQEPSVRECAGVSGLQKETENAWVMFYEGHTHVFIGPMYAQVRLTVSEARKLARQLNRLARRIEIRQEAGV